eukprot:COSAG04_NODE_15_length_40535_cov_25.319888_24_plen_1289_part_00
MPARGRPCANSTHELLEPAPRCIRVCASRAGALLLVLTSILAALVPGVGAAAPGASGATGVAPPAASPVDLAAAIAAGWGRPWAALPAEAHAGGEPVHAGRWELASSAREPWIPSSASDGAAAGVLVLDRAIGPLSSPIDDAVTSAAGWALTLPRVEGGPSAARRSLGRGGAAGGRAFSGRDTGSSSWSQSVVLVAADEAVTSRGLVGAMMAAQETAERGTAPLAGEMAAPEQKPLQAWESAIVKTGGPTGLVGRIGLVQEVFRSSRNALVMFPVLGEQVVDLCHLAHPTGEDRLQQAASSADSSAAAAAAPPAAAAAAAATAPVSPDSRTHMKRRIEELEQTDKVEREKQRQRRCQAAATKKSVESEIASLTAVCTTAEEELNTAAEVKATKLAELELAQKAHSSAASACKGKETAKERANSTLADKQQELEQRERDERIQVSNEDVANADRQAHLAKANQMLAEYDRARAEAAEQRASEERERAERERLAAEAKNASLEKELQEARAQAKAYAKELERSQHDLAKASAELEKAQERGAEQGVLQTAQAAHDAATDSSRTAAAQLVDLATDVLGSGGRTNVDSAQKLCQLLGLETGTPAGALLQNVMLFREMPETHHGAEAWEWASKALQNSETFRQKSRTFAQVILNGLQAAILDGGASEVALLGAGVAQGFGVMLEVDPSDSVFGFVGSDNGRYVDLSGRGGEALRSLLEAEPALKREVLFLRVSWVPLIGALLSGACELPSGTITAVDGPGGTPVPGAQIRIRPSASGQCVLPNWFTVSVSNMQPSGVSNVSAVTICGPTLLTVFADSEFRMGVAHGMGGAGCLLSFLFNPWDVYRTVHRAGYYQGINQRLYTHGNQKLGNGEFGNSGTRLAHSLEEIQIGITHGLTLETLMRGMARKMATLADARSNPQASFEATGEQWSAVRAVTMRRSLVPVDVTSLFPGSAADAAVPNNLGGDWWLVAASPASTAAAAVSPASTAAAAASPAGTPAAAASPAAPAAPADGEDEDKEDEEDEWLQCEQPGCGKWRRLPPGVPAASVPDPFNCSMHHWVFPGEPTSKARCSTPEEESKETSEQGSSESQLLCQPAAAPPAGSSAAAAAAAAAPAPGAAAAAAASMSYPAVTNSEACRKCSKKSAGYGLREDGNAWWCADCCDKKAGMRCLIAGFCEECDASDPKFGLALRGKRLWCRTCAKQRSDSVNTETGEPVSSIAAKVSAGFRRRHLRCLKTKGCTGKAHSSAGASVKCKQGCGYHQLWGCTECAAGSEDHRLCECKKDGPAAKKRKV